jgi:hypothetical protein
MGWEIFRQGNEFPHYAAKLESHGTGGKPQESKIP